MESIAIDIAYLKSLRQQATIMIADASSLAAVFSAEESRLHRMDQASRLRTLRSMVSQQVEEEKMRELSASYANTHGQLTASLVKLGLGVLIKRATENKRWQAVGDHLLKDPGRKEQPFGTVLVGIGSAGLPDEVEVVPVSRLARESGREESEVISEVEKRGYLMFTEKGFSSLIDRLIGDVQNGQLSLPVSAARLSETMAMTKHSPPQ